jgi:hypothetical protein
MSTAATNGGHHKDERLYFLDTDVTARPMLIDFRTAPSRRVQQLLGVFFDHLRCVSGPAPEWH